MTSTVTGPVEEVAHLAGQPRSGRGQPGQTAGHFAHRLALHGESHPVGVGGHRLGAGLTKRRTTARSDRGRTLTAKPAPTR